MLNENNFKAEDCKVQVNVSQDGRKRLFFHKNPPDLEIYSNRIPLQAQWSPVGNLKCIFSADYTLCVQCECLPGKKKKITLLRLIFPASGRSAWTTKEKLWMSPKPVPVTVIFLPPLKGRIKKEVKSLVNYDSYKLLYPALLLLPLKTAMLCLWLSNILQKGLLLRLAMTRAFKCSNVNFKLSFEIAE